MWDQGWDIEGEVKETMAVFECQEEVKEISPWWLMLIVVAPILATLIPLAIAYALWKFS